MKKTIYLFIAVITLSFLTERVFAGNLAGTLASPGDLRAAVNSLASGDSVVLTGTNYTWANGTSVLIASRSVKIKADPSLTVRPVVTMSGATPVLKYATPTSAGLSTYTFDGIDFNGGGVATGFLSIAPGANTGGNLKVVINNCVIRNLTAAATMFAYTASTGLTVYDDLTITNSRFIGFAIITVGGAKASSPLNINLRNNYFATYGAAQTMFTSAAGTGGSLNSDHCTYNKCMGTSKKYFNAGAGMTTVIKNNVFANETAGITGAQTLIANAASTNNTFFNCIGTLATRFPNMGAVTDIADPGVPTLPAVGSLTTADADYFSTSGKGYYNNAVVTKSTTSLSGFSYNEGSGPSNAQTFTVSGADLVSNLIITAPSNYEISSDGTTYAISLTFPPYLGVIATKTISVRLAAGKTAASYNGNITLETTNVTTQTIALTGSVSAGGSPAFTASTGSLSGFNYIYAQGPSTQQSFTVSGSNLAANVAIAAPTNYEVSTTSGSGFGTSASIPFGSGTLSAVPVYIRLKAGLNSGSYTAENIALTSGLATEQGVSCSGTVTPPTVTITPSSLTSFFALAGSVNPSTEKTFTVGGSNLAGNITLTAPTNYEISTGTGGSFAATNPITLSPSSGTLASTTIYVRLKGNLATASYNENITIATNGLTTQNVTCSGSVAVPTIMVGTSPGTDGKGNFAIFTYALGAGPSSTSTAYVTGVNLIGDITATAPAHFEISKDNSTFASSIIYTQSGGSISGQIWVRLVSGLLTDYFPLTNLVFSSSSATDRTNGLTGSVTGGAVIYGTTANNPITAPAAFSYSGVGPSSSSNNLKITCSGLTTDVTVTPPTGFEVSLNNVDFQSNALTVPHTAGAIAAGTTIYVRLKANLALGSHSGNITLETTDANTRSVAVSGTVNAATPTVTVTPIGTYTYNNTPQGPIAATNTGTGSSYTFSYAGTGTTTYGPSATLPTNAGTYTATATVAANGNYAQASSAATAFSILSTGAVSAANTNISSLTLSPSSVLTVSGTGSLILDANTNVSSITVAAGGELSIPSNLTTVSGTITLQSSASGTATLVDDYASPTRTATVQQYLPQGRNWYLSVPTSSGSASSFIGAGLATSVSYYDETANGTVNAWVNDYTGAMTAGIGYVAVSAAGAGSATNSASFTATLNSGDVPVTLTRTGTGSFAGYNLIANPYPSYVNPMTAMNGIDVVKTIWYRTKSGTYKFETVNTSSGVGTGSVTGYIPPMQAFWVRTNTNNVVLTFTNTMRDHANPTGVTTTIMKAKQEKQAIARVKINGNAGNDEAILYFNANASNSYDNYDSPKMFESVSAAIPEIYTQIGSEKLVINGMNTVPYETEIPVGFITKQAGDFTISANELSNFEAGTRVLLLDKNYPNVETELTTGTVYNFSAPVTAANTNRFSLLFRAPGASTGFNSAEKLNAQVYVNAANQIVISASEKASYSIYNAVGMLVENGQTTGKLQTVNCKLQTGMYVVKVNNETRRVIIK